MGSCDSCVSLTLCVGCMHSFVNMKYPSKFCASTASALRWHSDGTVQTANRAMLSALLLGAALIAPSKTPVTLLSGFLGAGKTTCLSHLLKHAEGLRLGVVVNDVAKLNIDAALISDAAASSEGDSVVRLENGCACCSLSGELQGRTWCTPTPCTFH